MKLQAALLRRGGLFFVGEIVEYTGMNRAGGWTGIVLLVLGLAVPAPAAEDRPNIIFVMADDLGYGDLGCYGQKRIRTPHLDRMAADGMKFTQFYAGSTVCAPSRCVLMTGLHTGHCFIRGNGKINLRPGDVTVAEVLKTTGYTCGLMGKWGLGHENSSGLPTRQGFDSFFGYLDQHHAHNYYPSFLVRNEKRVLLKNVVPMEGRFGQGVATRQVEYSHDLVMAETMTWLDKVHDRPFFLYLALTIPHANNEAGARGMEVPELGEFGDRDWPEPEKGFASMIRNIDRDTGRVLDLLTELGIEKDTLVIFTSDNGYFCGAHGLQGKVLPYDDASRIPLIIYHPGLLSAEKRLRTKAVVGNIDFAPTILDAAGIQIPWRMDGASLLPIVNDPMRKVRDVLGIIQNWDWTNRDMTKGLAITSEDWKYINWCYADRNITPAEELFNLNQDPAEMENRIDDPVAAGELTMLRDAYDQFHRHWAKHCVDGPYYKRYQQIFDRHIPWVEKQYLTIDSQLQQIEWQQKLQQQYQDLTGETYPVYDDG